MDRLPSIRAIFMAFLKMGSFAFGGVYSMLSFFERELVDKRKWLDYKDFAEGVVIGQMTPGPPIVNTGIFIGYRLGKLKGALAATAGQILPSFILILVIAYFYLEHRELRAMQAALKGVGAAVVGLIASVVWRMGRKSLTGFKPALFAVACFLGLAVFGLNPIVLIVLSGVAGIALFRREAV